MLNLQYFFKFSLVGSKFLFFFINFFYKVKLSFPTTFSRVENTVWMQSITCSRFSTLLTRKYTFLNPFKHTNNSLFENDFVLIGQFFIQNDAHHKFDKEHLLEVSVPLDEIVFEEDCRHLFGGFFL